MKDNNVLHCMDAEPKFMQSFIDFIKENFDYSKHKFIIREHFNDMKVNIDSNTIFLPKSYSKFKRLLIFMYQVNKADKIILHGLFHSDIIYALLLQPWILKKCYWIMWGGDFYFPETKSKIKHEIIKEMGYLVNVLENEYNLVKIWYGAKGRYVQSFGYPSNIFNHKSFHTSQKNINTLYILIGNSATETNHHSEILKKLEKYKNENIKIFAPLSYGDKDYAKKVTIEGEKIFKNKFIPIFDFMVYESYFQFLNTIDIAIFAHNRSQGMGNIINLLGLGKKVYIRTKITPWSFFKDKNIEIFDFEKIELSILDKKIQDRNTKNISSFFSEETLVNQLKTIFHVNKE